MRIEGVEDQQRAEPEWATSKEEDRGDEQNKRRRREGEHRYAVIDPRQPSEQERIGHELTHFPFRSWCMKFLRGVGKRGGLPKNTRGGKERSRDSRGTACSSVTRIVTGEATK